VSLGELIRLERRPVVVDPNAQYREIGIYCFGRGIFHKEPRSGLEVGDKSLFLLKKGDFILQVTFAWEGAMAIVSEADDGMYGSTRYPTFRVDENRVLPDFLLNYFRTQGGLDQIVRICPGSAGRNRVLSVRRIPEVQVPLPPLAEQARVVSLLQDIEVKISGALELRRQGAEETRALRASVLVNFLPTSAPQRELGDLVAADTSISYGVLVPGPDIADGIPFVRVQDLSIRTPPTTPAKRISPEIDEQYRRTRLVGGEVLVGVVGTIGKIGVAPETWAGANIARAVCRIVPGEAVDRDYLAMVLSASPAQAYFEEATRTLAQPTLNVSKLNKTPIPLPSLEAQHQIVRDVNAIQADVDALEAIQTDCAEELGGLLPSALSKAFTGAL